MFLLLEQHFDKPSVSSSINDRNDGVKGRVRQMSQHKFFSSIKNDMGFYYDFFFFI